MTSTHDKIIRAAEVLMAERGIDNVTFAEITRAAGQRNNSAVPYYFGDRAGLIRAVLAQHTGPIAERRRGLLDAIDPDPTLHQLADALVTPIAEEVMHAEGGAAYVRIVAHILGHPELRLDDLGARQTPVTKRLESGFRQAANLPPDVLEVRNDLVVTIVYHGLADRSRELADPGTAEATKRRFVDNLVDVIEAVFAATPSRRAPNPRATPRRSRARH
jgi:AcrR family transcriptional regulator